MKYMGSKRMMLTNGLGDLLRREVPQHKRFVDLFCGSGAVAWFVGRESQNPVLAVDIQKYSAALAGAVIGRTLAVNFKHLVQSFVIPAQAACCENPYWDKATELDCAGLCPANWANRARELCGSATPGVIFNAYGGHYFSPSQAIAFDSMLQMLPAKPADRAVCLAALLIAASDCAASPGHTAQPFQPTKTAGMYIREAWKRNVFSYVEKALGDLAPLHAQVRGSAIVGDAVKIAATLTKDDLVFIDPPYAGVHYSRFYHVLETIARGHCSTVSGVGRYPPPAERPASAFSRKGESRQAFDQLMSILAKRGCSAIVTFPASECSNGLSGDIVTDLASQYFHVTKKVVGSRFSTLGGNNSHRKARMHVEELILLLHPTKQLRRGATRIANTGMGYPAPFPPVRPASPVAARNATAAAR